MENSPNNQIPQTPQYQPGQTPYTPPPTMQYTQQPQVNPDDTLGNWMLTLFLAGIPVVGFILLLVWGFGSNPSGRRNYARAALIWQIISIVLWGILFAAMGSTIAGALRYY
ncbi:hypothetical protein LJC61_03885 [Ruminococcaceae bacterium OttesenSCG-928-A16]|nr:hypothetical protein [Ruminococcaceae bacterium OttesenSCG-928-A16]